MSGKRSAEWRGSSSRAKKIEARLQNLVGLLQIPHLPFKCPDALKEVAFLRDPVGYVIQVQESFGTDHPDDALRNVVR